MDWENKEHLPFSIALSEESPSVLSVLNSDSDAFFRAWLYLPFIWCKSEEYLLKVEVFMLQRKWRVTVYKLHSDKQMFICFAPFCFHKKFFISTCFRHDLFRKKLKILLKNITDIFAWAESIQNIPGTIYPISFMSLQPLGFKVRWQLLPKAGWRTGLSGCWACRDVWFGAVYWYCHSCQFGASLTKETEIFQAGWHCQNSDRQDSQLCTCLSRAVPA